MKLKIQQRMDVCDSKKTEISSKWTLKMFSYTQTCKILEFFTYYIIITIETCFALCISIVQ